MIVFLKEISGVALIYSKPLARFRKQSHFYIQDKKCARVHFFTELHKQTELKATDFNAVENFNHILQDIVKFRWYFVVRQHFSIDDTIHRLTFRSDLFDSKNDTRKPSSHDSHCVHAYTNTK